MLFCIFCSNRIKHMSHLTYAYTIHLELLDYFGSCIYRIMLIIWWIISDSHTLYNVQCKSYNARRTVVHMYNVVNCIIQQIRNIFILKFMYITRSTLNMLLMNTSIGTHYGIVLNLSTTYTRVKLECPPYDLTSINVNVGRSLV